MSSTEYALKYLRRAVLALSLAADEQIGLFPAQQPWAAKEDELALELENGILLMRDWGANEISKRDVAHLEAIDDLLKEMSGDKSLWNDEALRTHPAWEKVRVMAREVLQSAESSWPNDEPVNARLLFSPENRVGQKGATGE